MAYDRVKHYESGGVPPVGLSPWKLCKCLNCGTTFAGTVDTAFCIACPTETAASTKEIENEHRK